MDSVNLLDESQDQDGFNSRGGRSEGDDMQTKRRRPPPIWKSCAQLRGVQLRPRTKCKDVARMLGLENCETSSNTAIEQRMIVENLQYEYTIAGALVVARKMGFDWDIKFPEQLLGQLNIPEDHSIRGKRMIRRLYQQLLHHEVMFCENAAAGVHMLPCTTASTRLGARKHFKSNILFDSPEKSGDCSQSSSTACRAVKRAAFQGEETKELQQGGVTFDSSMDISNPGSISADMGGGAGVSGSPDSIKSRIQMSPGFVSPGLSVVGEPGSSGVGGQLSPGIQLLCSLSSMETTELFSGHENVTQPPGITPVRSPFMTQSPCFTPIEDGCGADEGRKTPATRVKGPSRRRQLSFDNLGNTTDVDRQNSVENCADRAQEQGLERNHRAIHRDHGHEEEEQEENIVVEKKFKTKLGKMAADLGYPVPVDTSVLELAEILNVRWEFYDATNAEHLKRGEDAVYKKNYRRVSDRLLNEIRHGEDEQHIEVQVHQCLCLEAVKWGAEHENIVTWTAEELRKYIADAKCEKAVYDLLLEEAVWRCNGFGGVFPEMLNNYSADELRQYIREALEFDAQRYGVNEDEIHTLSVDELRRRCEEAGEQPFVHCGEEELMEEDILCLGTQPLGSSFMVPGKKPVEGAVKARVIHLRDIHKRMQYNKFLDATKAFQVGVCDNCCEAQLSGSSRSVGAPNEWITQPDGQIFCDRCGCKNKKGGLKKAASLWGAGNNMDPGTVPPELADLSEVEEMLIAKVAAIIKVEVLKGGVLASKGNCIAFTQNNQFITRDLPRLPQNVEYVFVRRTSAVRTANKKFRVRRHKVQQALMWLHEHNDFYRDIIINEDSLSKLPQDGSVEDVMVEVGTIESADVGCNLPDHGPAPDQNTEECDMEDSRRHGRRPFAHPTRPILSQPADADSR